MALAACGPPPPLRVMQCAAAPSPRIERQGETRRTTLSVLTYNLEGLAWPARSGRPASLREIGERLAAMNRAGAAPDVVLVQEMFSPAAKRAVSASGYPAIVSGPRRTARKPSVARDRLPGKSRLKRGEVGLRLLGSGLAIASRYPIVASEQRPFGRRSCAGFDCLANKGVMLARIVIPGVPVGIDLFNIHMNARGASKAPAERNLAAHDRQAEQASAFIAATSDLAGPTVFGGDFNMRNSEERWDNFTRYRPLALVHRVCVDPAAACDVRLSWDGDAPWMDTQDLQFFASGSGAALRPIRVEAMFDGGPSGPRLSDHDGLLVTYEIRWRGSAATGNPC